MSLYGLYERTIFPRLMEFGMRWMEDLRSGVLESARGEVLEVGFGTGLNLPHYPEGVRSLAALDPLEPLPGRVQARIDAAPFPVERHALAADGGLPFEPDRFDTVVMTWTLCSIADPHAALLEMRRVLRPEGRLLFIEHGRSDDPRVARWQDRLNPIQRWVGCGCNLNRRIDALIREAGFGLSSLERFRLEHGPRIYAELYSGIAI